MKAGKVSGRRSKVGKRRFFSDISGDGRRAVSITINLFPPTSCLLPERSQYASFPPLTSYLYTERLSPFFPFFVDTAPGLRYDFEKEEKLEGARMRIVFVRHGEPDYERDCLTETGRRQALAAAARLERENITEIYSSPMGRARETAACTAERLGLPIHILDFMHEISWGGPGVAENGHPWTLGDYMIAREDFDFYGNDWRKHPYFEKNEALNYYDMIAEKIDAFLLSQGYRHEGARYYCDTREQKTIALFSHGGSGGCALSHLLALPFPYVCSVLPYDFTSIIILDFPVEKGSYVHTRVELFNDCAHIHKTEGGPRIQQKPDG